jgi:hypothetical protein
MTFGPATVLAFAAAVLATLVWYLVNSPRPALNPTLAIFLFGLLLALVVLAGPIINAP